jgi:hypothetical protein
MCNGLSGVFVYFFFLVSNTVAGLQLSCRVGPISPLLFRGSASGRVAFPVVWTALLANKGVARARCFACLPFEVRSHLVDYTSD